MNISIVGTGYVGLVTGTCFADVGNQVLCVDVDEEKINKLEQGVIPIYEPGLERLVKANIEQQRLSFTTDIAEAVKFADVIFIAVGTPSDEDGSADLSHVKAVAKSIGQVIEAPKVVLTKSTVPVGTAAKVRAEIESELDKRGLDLGFSVGSNPEFLKEGAAVNDFMKPDRIVIGADDEETVEMMRTLYAPFNRNHDRLIVMDIPSAELTKYAANAMLATKISFMNELSNLADRLGADIELVRQGIGSDPRIGYHFIYPGSGYGGSCFPKDVQALQRTAEEQNYNARILEAVEEVNHKQKSVLLNKVLSRFESLGGVQGKTFALWGLAFKPNTDDMREAPSRVLIEGLLAKGANIKAFDPIANHVAAEIYRGQSGISFEEDAYLATEEAEALLIVTEWQAFKSPDFERLKSQLRQPFIFDGRNIYEPAIVRDFGFEYFCIGRPNQ